MAEESDRVLCEFFSCLQELAGLRKQYDRLVGEGYIELARAKQSLVSNSLGQLQYPQQMQASVFIETSESEQVRIVHSKAHNFRKVPHMSMEEMPRASPMSRLYFHHDSTPCNSQEQNYVRIYTTVSVFPYSPQYILLKSCPPRLLSEAQSDFSSLKFHMVPSTTTSYPSVSDNATTRGELRQRRKHLATDDNYEKASSGVVIQLGKENPLRWFSALPPGSLRQSQTCFKAAIEVTIAMVTAQARLADLHGKYAALSQQPHLETIGPKS